MFDRTETIRHSSAGPAARDRAAAGAARLAAAWLALVPAAAAQAGGSDAAPPTAQGLGPVAPAVRRPPAAVPDARAFGDIAVRGEPVMLAGKKVDWREIPPTAGGVLHVPGVAAPVRRWRLDGTVGDANSTKRVPVSGEALAAAGGGAIVVAFFVPEKNFRRRVRSNTKDSRRAWTLLKRGRPVEIGSGSVEPRFSPSAFKYAYTLLRVSLPDGARACAAFHGKRDTGGNYGGSVGGYLCAPPGVDLVNAQVAGFLRGIAVGSGAREAPGDLASLFGGASPRLVPADDAAPAVADSGPRTVSPTRERPAPLSPPLAVVAAVGPPAALFPARVAPLGPAGADAGLASDASARPDIGEAPRAEPPAAPGGDQEGFSEACARYLGDQAMHLRCQWLTDPERTDVVPAAGVNAPLESQMRCHPSREEPALYIACIQRG